MRSPLLVALASASAGLLLLVGSPLAEAGLREVTSTPLEATEGQVPALATDAHGNFVLLAFGSRMRPAVLDRPRGGVFGAPQDLLPPDLRSEAGELAVSPRGDAAVLLELEPPAASVAPSPERSEPPLVASVRSVGSAFGALEPVPGTEAEGPPYEIAADARGDVIVVFTDDRFRLLASVRPENGSFGPPEVLAERAGGFDVEVDGTGKTVVAFTTGSGEVKVTRRTPGVPFEPARAIGRGDGIPAVGVNGTGDVAVAWTRGPTGDSQRLDAAVGSIRQGLDFSPGRRIARPPTEGPRVIVDRAGAATVVWEQDFTDMPVVTARSRPRGRSWGRTLALSRRDAYLNSVGLDSRGVVTVLWARNTARSGVDEYTRGTPRRGFGRPRTLRGDGFLELTVSSSGEVVLLDDGDALRAYLLEP